MNKNTVCPLILDPNSYNPDTLDLSVDEEARNYWLNCISELVKKFTTQAAKSQSDDSTAAQRANQFRMEFINKINLLKQNPGNSEPLTIRTLLDLNESCLRLYGFTDPWLEQKNLENIASIGKFQKRLIDLDKLEFDKKWIELVKGLLAGNMFDWGAQAVSQILENESSFGLQEALKCIQPRPWLIDGFDEWLERLQGPSHKCAAIFVDNSGVDIVLGILPFARELILRQTKVILCANTEPALNDITYQELDNVLKACCDQCSILKRARESEQLIIYGSGQSSPCLDFRKLSPDLCEAMIKHETDLLVIEGMGRALHTNLYSKFKCETLKLAVIKNKWWANRLGGETFSVICKYETV